MAEAIFEWYGDEVFQRIRDAEGPAITRTVQDAADRARQVHGWKNITGAEEATITAFEAERETANLIVGSFGAGQVPFPWPVTRPAHPKTWIPAIYLEFGTHASELRPWNTRPFPFLRPAGAIEFPKLAGRLRELI